MLEYAVKKVITNPTIMTQASEIIKIVDNRSHKTKAFILPLSYAPLIEKLQKEIEFKQWVDDKKQQLNNSTTSTQDNLDDIMYLGINNFNSYLKES